MTADAWAGYCRLITDMHVAAGRPAVRAIAAATEGATSHATVNDILRGKRVPAWRTLEKVTVALGGDVEAMRSAWAEVVGPGAAAQMSPVPPAWMPQANDMLDELVAIRALLQRVVELMEKQTAD